MELISLPSVELRLSRQVKAESLFVLGGRPPAVAWLTAVAAGRDVWAVDRGADACMAAGVTPSRLLGDFDSIGSDARTWAERLHIEKISYPRDKDETDFQLALSMPGSGVIVSGCWGGRFDHAFSNVFSTLTARDAGRTCLLADEQEVLVPIAGGEKLTLTLLAPTLAVSLLPLSESCEGVSISGVKWPLQGAMLQQNKPWAISNAALGGPVSVSLDKGLLGVYCVFPITTTP